MQDTIKKDEGGDAHVRGAMDKDPAILESIHHAAESLEVPRSGSFKIDWDVDIAHSKSRDDAAFIWNGVIRRRKRQIDDGVEASFADRSQLRLGRLTCCAKSFGYGTEVINLK